MTADAERDYDVLYSKTDALEGGVGRNAFFVGWHARDTEIERLGEQLREGNARFAATVEAGVAERTERLRQQNATLLRWLEAIVVGPDVTARSTARAALAQAEPEEPR